MHTVNHPTFRLAPALLLVLAACGDDAPTGDGPDRERDTGRTSDDTRGVDDADAEVPDDDVGSPDVGTDTVPDTEPAIDATSDAGAVDDTAPADTTTDVTPDTIADVSDAGAGDVDVDETFCELDDAHRYACCVFDAVNAYRGAQGLDPYVFDSALTEVGFYYADYMASNGVYAHSADGMNFGERLDEFDVAWQSAGENLQRNDIGTWQAACNETVNGRGGWANSSAGHREAMLGQDRSGTDKAWSHAGVGVARAGGDWYVAMYFVRY